MNYLTKTHESYNSYYKMYRAKWCKQTGLPMYSKKDYEVIEKEKLYSKTRAKKEKIQVNTNKVCAWYRMPNGYIPLFRKENI